MEYIILGGIVAVAVGAWLWNKGSRRGAPQPSAQHTVDSAPEAAAPRSSPATPDAESPGTATPNPSPDPSPKQSPIQSPIQSLKTSPKTAPVRTWSAPVAADTPPELRNLRVLRLSDVHRPVVDALLERLSRFPRPPQALQKLVSPEFLAQASADDLQELMVGEPQIAARVLAAVNSPYYGLQRPLGSIGQAATYLGMDTIRNICTRHLLDASFRPTSDDMRAAYDVLWNATALSSELCVRLAPALQLRDTAALGTQVLLSHLGALATTTLLEGHALHSLASASLIARTHYEQEHLGLGAAELASMLMGSWKVPASLISEVRDIDRVLVLPPEGFDAARQPRMALGYVCSRLGAMLSSGRLRSLKHFDVVQAGADFHHLQAYLRHPDLQPLPELLRSDALDEALAPLLPSH